MLSKPRFPLLLTLTAWLFACGLYPVTSWTMHRAHEVWPGGIFILYTLVFITLVAHAAMSINRYYDALALRRFHQRRLNPSAVHIHE